MMLADADVRSASLLKLHTRDVEFGGLGGHVWSKKWAAYLHLSVTTRRAEWWRNAYTASVVERSLGPDAYEAVLCWQCDGEGYHTVNSRYSRNPAWLGIQADRARKIAAGLWKN